MSGPRREAGQLGPQVEGYQAWLMQRGYTSGTVRNMLKTWARSACGYRLRGWKRRNWTSSGWRLSWLPGK